MTGLDRPKIRERGRQSCPRGQLCPVPEQAPEPRGLFLRGARCGRWDSGRAALGVQWPVYPGCTAPWVPCTSVPAGHLVQYWPGYPASPYYSVLVQRSKLRFSLGSQQAGFCNRRHGLKALPPPLEEALLPPDPHPIVDT